MRATQVMQGSFCEGTPKPSFFRDLTASGAAAKSFPEGELP